MAQCECQPRQQTELQEINYVKDPTADLHYTAAPFTYYHWFVEEREPLHGVQGICCGNDITEDNPRLPSHAVGFEANYVKDFAELPKHGIQTLPQLCNRES